MSPNVRLPKFFRPKKRRDIQIARVWKSLRPRTQLRVRGLDVFLQFRRGPDVLRRSPVRL